MGNVTSHRFLEEESVVDWGQYVVNDWRSARVRELDQLGGLARPALPLGESFNRKLEYLGANVLEQASEITDLFTRKKHSAAAGAAGGNDAHTVAVEKRRIRRKGMPGVLEVAEWRFRVHAARKRIFLVILVCVRLRVGLKRPTRLRRMDTFSYMIPLIFGDDSPKFIEAQLIAIASKDKAAHEVEAAQSRLAKELLAAEPHPDPASATESSAHPRPDPDPAHTNHAAQPLDLLPVAHHPPSVQLPRLSPDSDGCPSPKYAGPMSPMPDLLMSPGAPKYHGAMSPGPKEPMITKRSSYPGPDPSSPVAHMTYKQSSYPGPSSSSLGNMHSPKSKLLLSPAGKGAYPGKHGFAQAGPKPHGADSILDTFPSVSTSPDSLSPTDSTASCKGSPDVQPQPQPPLDMPSGASSPCARISEDGIVLPHDPAPGVVSVFSDSSALSPAVQFPPIKQRSSMLPLPGHRQRHISESGFANTGASHHSRLVGRASDQSRLSTRASVQSEAGMGPPSGDHKSQLPMLPNISASVSTSSPGDGESSLEARVAARSARYNAMKEREKSARKAGVPSWNSLFKKPQPNEREARKSAPNLSLPAIPGASRPAAKSARQGSHMSKVFAALRPSPPLPRFTPVNVPSMSRHALREQAAEDLLARARQLDPAWSMGDSTRRRLLSRSFSVVEQEDGQRAEMMLSMYTNRCNTAWSSQQQWSAPSVTPPDSLRVLHSAPSISSSQEYNQSLAHLRRGRVAFWFMVGEDCLPIASTTKAATGPATTSVTSQSQDIWTSDPYDFISSCRPGLLHDMRHKIVKGHTFQSRALGALALSILDVGGKDALAKALIILSISDDQEEEVTKSLWDNKFYGFGRENVVIIAQSKRLGYRYDLGSQRFIGVLNTAPESTGSGYAAMQLNWCPDAFVLSPEGLVQAIQGTPMELMAQRGVQWMLCHRARDLATMQGCLNSSFLSLGDKLLGAQGINMMMQVVSSDNMGTARALDSIVLKRNGAGNTELRMAELSSHVLDKAVESAKAENNNMVAVGIQRYLFHVPSLRKLLVQNRDFRPKLKVRDGLLFLRYEISDLTSVDGCVLGAVQVQKPELLTTHKDLDMLLAAAQHQDNDHRLMTHLEELRPKIPPTPQQLAIMVQQARPEKAGLGATTTTVVFLDQALSSLPAVRLAVALARPTKDTINLCTFVQDAVHIESGRAMLMNVVERLGSTSIQIRVDVVVRDAASMLDCMCRYLKTWQADLVVVTTRGLTKTEPSAILGSVCLAIIKRVDVPVLIVTPKSAQASNSMYDKRMVRMMAMVEGWTMPLLEYTVDRLILSRRGDQLLLGQVCSSRICTKQQAFNMRRYINEAQRFVDSKSVERSQILSLDGLYEQVIEQTVQDYRVNLVGVQLPPGSKALPKSLISLICCSSSAIMVFKKPPPEPDEEQPADVELSPEDRE